jgi:hypothetical protein
MNGFICPSVMKDSFTEYSKLGESCFFPGLEIHHSMSSFVLEFLLRNLLLFWSIFYVTWCFSLAAFNFLSLFCMSNVLTKGLLYWMGICFSRFGVFCFCYWICFLCFSLHLFTFSYTHVFQVLSLNSVPEILHI